jgi:hypothetical protein
LSPIGRKLPRGNAEQQRANKAVNMPISPIDGKSRFEMQINLSSPLDIARQNV